MHRQALSGSAIPHPRAEAAEPGTEPLRATLHLKPAEDLDPAALMALGALPPARRAHATAEELRARHGARPEDLDLVADFAAAHGLAVAERDPQRRTVVLEGSPAAMAEAFRFTWGRTAGGHAVPMGELHLPADLAPRVAGVLGLDARPRLRPHVRHQPCDDAGAPTDTTYVGREVPSFAGLYAFPEATGKGRRIGVVELGGGYTAEDMAGFFGALGLPVPAIRDVSVAGARNDPANASFAERLEVTLDLQVAGALAPGAELVAYFAPNTDEGFMQAIEAALGDAAGVPDVISVSWGSAESAWSPLNLSLFDSVMKRAAAQGVTVLCSSGDSGSSDGVDDGKAHVNFPAASTWVLGCGGTNLAESSECVWNDHPQPSATGGGVSDVLALPDYQKAAGVPPSANDGQVRRGVPDLAAHADRQGGYKVFVQGQWLVLGGTSAATPLWAALAARCGEALGAPCGFLNPYLYGNAAARAALRPVATGDNGAYKATGAYSCCTGLGTPDGQKLLEALRG